MQDSLFQPTTPQLVHETNFVDNMKLPVHRWYRYSAGFSAEWVTSLLNNSKNPGNMRVLDPFVGSGTTLLAADKCRVSSVGLETHPFVARIAKAKLLWHVAPETFRKKMSNILSRAKKIYETSNIEFSSAPELIQKTYTEHAFKKLESLRVAWTVCADNSQESELAWLAITSILRFCSHAGTAPWQYVLPNKSKAKVAEPYEAISAQVRMMLDDMEKLQSYSRRSLATLQCADARKLDSIESKSIDLIVTSPPYANNYDYADATRLEMTFWGEIGSWGDLQPIVRQYLIRSCTQHVSKERLQLDTLLNDSYLKPILSDLEPTCRELEEERHLHGGKKQYHLMVAAYFADMARVWQSLRRVSKDDVSVHFIVGDSAPYGIYIPVAKWHAILARNAGFDSIAFDKTRDRNVKWRNRTHSELLSEGNLRMEGTIQEDSSRMDGMERTGSATHKLGQMIGNFFEDFFEESLNQVAVRHSLYCDSKGLRPKVRGKRKKVTWQDGESTPHDLDYVLERHASDEVRGKPAAFVELAWRRYTKHSRNKAGEIEGALYHLGNTYSGAFLGAILAGEWSNGSLQQMRAHDINVLHIPFDDVADTFDTKNINLRYEEKSRDDVKWPIIEQWEQLTEEHMSELRAEFANRVDLRLQGFLANLEESLRRYVTSVRIWYLYGKMYRYTNIEEAISDLTSQPSESNDLEFVKFEIQVRFSNDDKVEGEFHEKSDAIRFLQAHADVEQ